MLYRLKNISLASIFIIVTFVISCAQQNKNHSKKPIANNTTMKLNKLTPEEEYVILNKGTERPFTGKLNDVKDKGIFTCRQCNKGLFLSEYKFDSKSGWPSFDDAIPNAVEEHTDSDGHRTEIVCGRCKGHLGHVFRGEQMTEKSTRHCVNSISMDFVKQENLDTAIFASGCFWGTEYFFERAEGVLFTTIGYTGGKKENPTYKEVCTGATGHAEAVLVVYDKTKTDYETLTKLFFETHDPSQKNRQGPDVGTQYRTGIFYRNDKQKDVAEKLISELKAKGVNVVTEITPLEVFWSGEEYHKNYYTRKGTLPYCHIYQKKFD